MTIPDGMIDVHTHVYPRELADWPIPPGALRWPCLRCEAPDRGTITRDGAFYRALDDRSWSLDRRLADMDAEGVAFQVLSPTPVSYAYDAPAVAAHEHARAQNEAIATYVRTRPDRFAGFGTVALQDVERACAEAERAVTELGLLGVEIGTLVGELALDDPAFDPFFATCERSGATIFIHPEATLAPARFAHRGLTFSTGYPTETGVTTAALLMAGLFERYPRLRVLLAHGGGTLAWMLPRLDVVWASNPANRDAATLAPSASARNFFVDTLVNDAQNIALLAARFGAGQLLVGSDYPFPIRENPVGAAVVAEIRRSARVNALRFLDRSAP